MKHTPGPWKMVETLIGDYDPDSEKPDNRQLTHMIVSETGKLITYDLPPTSISDEFWANAALLEAAPELLKALKQLAKEHQDLLNEHHGFYPMGCIDYVFKAIAKAEGGDDEIYV